MEILKNQMGEVPREILEAHVQNCQHLYYELTDGSFMILAGPPDSRAIHGARVNLLAADVGKVTALIQAEDFDEVRDLGIGDEIMVLLRPAIPLPPPVMTFEEAETESQGKFPRRHPTADEILADRKAANAEREAQEAINPPPQPPPAQPVGTESHPVRDEPIPGPR